MATFDSKPEVTRIEIVTWSPNPLTKNLFQQLFHQFLNSEPLVCMQEVRINSVKNDHSINESFDTSFVKEKETYQAVSIPKSGSVYVTDCKESEIPLEVCDLRELRCSGKRVTHKQSKKSFILISYHGEYKCSKEEDVHGSPSAAAKDGKYDKLKSFISAMKDLAKHYNLVVIVGGNFNYKVIKWKTKIEKEFADQVVVAPLYAGVPNRRLSHNVIDTFIAVYPDNPDNVVTCKFGIPIPICMFPTTGYIGENETKFLNYPNNDHPCCKVLYYNNKDLQTLKTNLEGDNLEELYKDNNTDAVLPLWPGCETLKKSNHDPVMVTVELVSHKSTNNGGPPLEEQVSV